MPICVMRIGIMQKRAIGGAEGIRTPDLLTASQTRSQLRHGPTHHRAEGLMIPPTFNPPLRSPLPMQTREIDRSELKGGGYLATPDGTGPHPGVIVIHEAYGLTDNIKGIARRFADAGYLALAVDLFTGRNRAVCITRYMAGLLLGAVNPYGVNDLKTALTFLAKNRDVDAQRMGAIGFCMGGGCAVR